MNAATAGHVLRLPRPRHSDLRVLHLLPFIATRFPPVHPAHAQGRGRRLRCALRVPWLPSAAASLLRPAAKAHDSDAPGRRIRCWHPAACALRLRSKSALACGAGDVTPQAHAATVVPPLGSSSRPAARCPSAKTAPLHAGAASPRLPLLRCCTCALLIRRRRWRHSDSYSDYDSCSSRRRVARVLVIDDGCWLRFVPHFTVLALRTIQAGQQQNIRRGVFPTRVPAALRGARFGIGPAQHVAQQPPAADDAAARPSASCASREPPQPQRSCCTDTPRVSPRLPDRPDDEHSASAGRHTAIAAPHSLVRHLTWRARAMRRLWLPAPAVPASLLSSQTTEATACTLHRLPSARHASTCAARDSSAAVSVVPQTRAASTPGGQWRQQAAQTSRRHRTR